MSESFEKFLSDDGRREEARRSGATPEEVENVLELVRSDEGRERIARRLGIQFNEVTEERVWEEFNKHGLSVFFSNVELENMTPKDRQREEEAWRKLCEEKMQDSNRKAA